MNSAEPVLSSDPSAVELDEPQIFPVSAWASVACGLFGSISVGYSQTLAVPIIGMGLALLALRKRDGYTVHPVAKGVACLGLALGAFFASAAGYAEYRRNHKLLSHADSFARSWLEVLWQREYEYATELTKSRGNRQMLGADLPGYYAGLTGEDAGKFEMIKGHAVSIASELSEGKNRPSWKQVERPRLAHQYTTDTIVLTYQDENGVIPGKIQMVLKREHDHVTNQYEWWVESH